MSGRYAQGTEVSVEKSRAEIEKILAKYGAESFAYGTQPGRAMVGFQVKDTTGVTLAIRMILPLPDRSAVRFTQGWQGYPDRAVPPHAANARWEQACRSSWRALLLVIKAKLEACAAGISTIEREFLADVVVPGGQTIGEMCRPQLAAMSQRGQVPRLMLGSVA